MRIHEKAALRIETVLIFMILVCRLSSNVLHCLWGIAGKRTLVVRLGLDVASSIHAAGMVFAHIFLVWLFYAAYMSKITFLLLLIPAPIGLRQVDIFVYFSFTQSLEQAPFTSENGG